MRDDSWNVEDDDTTFTVELEDLPPEETGTLSGALFHVGERVIQRVRALNVRFDPPEDAEDPEDDECEFDIRITHIPQEDLPTPTTSTPVASFARRFATSRRPRAVLFTLLLLVMAFVLVNTVGPVHDRVMSFLFPPAATQSSSFTYSTYNGPILNNPTNVAISENKTTILPVTTNGKQKYLLIPAPLPYECPINSGPGYSGQVGNFPVWLSDFGGANTILHLQPSFVSNLRDWQGWVIHFHMQVKTRYMGLVILSVNDINHGSTPLLRDPANGMQVSRVTVTSPSPRYASGIPQQSLLATWDMSLYLSGSGCYTLDGSWNGGNWEIVFEAGK